MTISVTRVELLVKHPVTEDNTSTIASTVDGKHTTGDKTMGMKDAKPVLEDCKAKVPEAAEPDAAPDAERKIERAAPRPVMS